jgi:hypothetical protein
LEGLSHIGTESPNGPVDPKHDESQTGHPGSNARPPSAPEKTAPDNHESHNGSSVSEAAGKDVLGTRDRRNQSKAQKPTVVEVAASHSNYVSQPAAVVDLIKKAASKEPNRALTKDGGRFVPAL